MTVRAKTTPSSTAGSFAATPAVRSRVDLASDEARHLAAERRYRFSTAPAPIHPSEAEHVARMELDGWHAAKSYWRMRRYGASHTEALDDADTVAADVMAIEWYGTVRAAGGSHADAMSKVAAVHTHTYATRREHRPASDGGTHEVWIVTCNCGHREEKHLSGRYTGD